MPKLKFAIVGLGAIGGGLFKILHNKEEIEISAVCDIQKDLAQKVSEEYDGIPYYTNHQEMLQQADIDVVYVAVPPKFHEEVVMDVIRANKHIFCEKPLANSLAEAHRMVEAVRNTDIVHAMHFPLNYQQGLRQFQQFIADGYIGKLRRITLKMHFPHWPRKWQQNSWVGGKEQGGFILEVGVHWFQALQKIFGPVAQTRSALQFPDDPNACESGIIAEMELEDGTPVLVDGLSGIAGDEDLQFSAYGEEGTVTLKNWRTLFIGKVGEPMQEIKSEKGSPHVMVDELIKAYTGQGGEIYSFEDGYQAQKVLEALRHPDQIAKKSLL